MNLTEYIDYKNRKDKEFEVKDNLQEDEDIMMEEIKKKISQIEEICKRKNTIKYTKNFKFISI